MEDDRRPSQHSHHTYPSVERLTHSRQALYASSHRCVALHVLISISCRSTAHSHFNDSLARGLRHCCKSELQHLCTAYVRGVTVCGLCSTSLTCHRRNPSVRAAGRIRHQSNAVHNTCASLTPSEQYFYWPRCPRFNDTIHPGHLIASQPIKRLILNSAGGQLELSALNGRSLTWGEWSAPIFDSIF